MRAVAVRPRAGSTLKDYTRERLIAEGKLAPEAPVLYVAPTIPPASSSSACTIAARLEERFGLGEDPGKRRALYKRLQRLAEQRGKEAELWIYEAADKAGDARDPGRYFSAAIVRMLRQVEVYQL